MRLVAFGSWFGDRMRSELDWYVELMRLSVARRTPFWGLLHGSEGCFVDIFSHTLDDARVDKIAVAVNCK